MFESACFDSLRLPHLHLITIVCQCVPILCQGDNKAPETDASPPQNTADLTAFVQNLLQQMVSLLAYISLGTWRCLAGSKRANTLRNYESFFYLDAPLSSMVDENHNFPLYIHIELAPQVWGQMRGLEGCLTDSHLKV